MGAFVRIECVCDDCGKTATQDVALRDVVRAGNDACVAPGEWALLRDRWQEQYRSLICPDRNKKRSSHA